jgi:hypothetical protein
METTKWVLKLSTVNDLNFSKYRKETEGKKE